MPPCPFCGDTRRYTDPLLQVRCVTCFNHLDGEPGVPIGAVQDLDAPLVVSGDHVYPGAFTYRDRLGSET